jgi:DNA primase
MLRLTSEADVNHRLQIIEVLKHYNVQGLVLFGSILYKGVCPFCHETEFQAMPLQGLWSCFACKRAGRTLDLVAEIERLPRAEAIDLINTWVCGESITGSVVCL